MKKRNPNIFFLYIFDTIFPVKFFYDEKYIEITVYNLQFKMLILHDRSI